MNFDMDVATAERAMAMRAAVLAIALLAAPAAASAQCNLPPAYPAAGDMVEPRYAENQAWYANHAPITVQGLRWVKYGLPRTVPPDDLIFVGQYDGVPTYAEKDAETVAVLYALLNSRCEVHAYESHHWFRALYADPAPGPYALPAVIEVSGCPAGAELFIFSAAEIAADPGWRSKLVTAGPHHLASAGYQRVMVFSATPQPYDVVLAYRGRAWRYRVDAIPGRETTVDARPPHLRHCKVPVYPVM